jgi:hypothetical protein
VRPEDTRRPFIANTDKAWLQSAERRWRAVNAPHLVALVRAGARSDKGILVERPDDHESRCDRQVA